MTSTPVRWPRSDMANPFRLMDAARCVRDDVNALIDASPRLLLHHVQLRESAESIPANVREAYGRRAGPEREQFLRYARGSAEETDEHLRANFASRRVPPAPYWRLHNRLTVIVRMITALLSDP